MRSAKDFELISEDHLAVVCFRYIPNVNDTEADIEQLQKDVIPALEIDGRVFIMGTQLHGKKVIRACLINHRMQESDLDYLLNVIRDVGMSCYRRFMN